MAEKGKRGSRESVAARRRGKRIVTDGLAHIHSSYNNTIITFTDRQGRTIGWSSAGAAGFKG
ncbi:MAG: 30S ribosomal protein S11, partial [Gammaproteobacteria bacterium]|nr:30S ribosomal protein S11 [Gammaproteobacteria bacterium]